MPEFDIKEDVVYTVEAATPREALDKWLHHGEDAARFVSVNERTLTGPDGTEYDDEDLED